MITKSFALIRSYNLSGGFMVCRFMVCRFAVCTIIACGLLLSSCSMQPTFHSPEISDGAPNIPVDLNQVVEPTPKSEPISRYGNHSPYTVLGKTYQVWSTEKQYKEEGVASWYGTKFHGQHTSSWEPYNMLSMTAAHKHLPLPSFVKVTNVDNQQSIIVRVNDRGPFHDNRIIDLSYAAAMKLGYAEKGTANVIIETVAMPYLPTSPQALASIKDKDLAIAQAKKDNNGKATSSAPAIYVQAGAFSKQDAADNLKVAISALTDTPIKVVKQEQQNAGTQTLTLYKVQIGPLYNPERAQLLSQLIRDTQLAQPIVLTEQKTLSAIH